MKDDIHGSINIAFVMMLIPTLIILVALLPSINTIIDLSLPYLGGMEQMLIQTIPFAVILGLLATFFLYPATS